MTSTETPDPARPDETRPVDPDIEGVSPAQPDGGEHAETFHADTSTGQPDQA